MKIKLWIFFILQIGFFSSGNDSPSTRPTPSLELISEKYRHAQIQILENQITPEHSPLQISQMQMQDSTIEDFSNLLHTVSDQRNIIISTDSEAVLSESIAFDQKTPRKGWMRAIPLGKLNEKLKDNTFTRFYDHLKQAAKNDKIGLTIATLTTATDCFVWFHATQFSPEVRAAQMIFTTLSAILFSIDKDFWAHNARKIQNKILTVYDTNILSTLIEQNSLFYKLSSIYLANLAMGMIYQSSRLSLLSIDQVLTSRYILETLLTAAVVSTAYTFATFAWSELNASIDQAKKPFAKFIVRRWAETRSIILGQLASSGKVLQPEIYGAAPWIAMTISGALGVATLLKSDKIINWFESGSMLQTPRDLFYKSTRKQKIVIGGTCSEIFL